jgi:hypothetical protein
MTCSSGTIMVGRFGRGSPGAPPLVVMAGHSQTQHHGWPTSPAIRCPTYRRLPPYVPLTRRADRGPLRAPGGGFGAERWPSLTSSRTSRSCWSHRWNVKGGHYSAARLRPTHRHGGHDQRVTRRRCRLGGVRGVHGGRSLAVGVTGRTELPCRRKDEDPASFRWPCSVAAKDCRPGDADLFAGRR